MRSSDLRKMYRSYIYACNNRQYDDLHAFVAPEVVASETATGLDAYIDGIRAVVSGFNDYHWNLEHLIVDDVWLAARLTGTGTHTGTFRDIPATGRHITVQELALYRTDHQKIVHCWGDLGAVIRDQLVSETPPPG